MSVNTMTPHNCPVLSCIIEVFCTYSPTGLGSCFNNPKYMYIFRVFCAVTLGAGNCELSIQVNVEVD